MGNILGMVLGIWWCKAGTAAEYTSRQMIDSTQTPEKGLFSTLPGELNNNIYRSVLVCTEPVHINEDKFKLSTALLQVNRRILAEATKIFYVENTFSIAYAND